eukprot:scaffold32910_cov86-Isochrysis_galbana.AAC.3
MPFHLHLPCIPSCPCARACLRSIVNAKTVSPHRAYRLASRSRGYFARCRVQGPEDPAPCAGHHCAGPARVTAG